MRGLIVINGYPNGEKFYKQAEYIRDALKKMGLETEIRKNGEIFALLTADGGVKSNFLQKYSFAVYLDKDKYLGKLLERAGIRLFNRAEAVEICDDKMTTYLALTDSELSLAESIPAPLCYTPNAKPNTVFLEATAQTLGFPLVAKKSYGSFGYGVQLVPGMPELQKTEEEWLDIPHFYQRYITESCGRDIRVIVVGGKAIGGMERVAQGAEFRSNIELGGIGRKIELTEEVRKAAEMAAIHLGLDYCGVDILQGEKGPVICEVNSNAFFEGFQKVTGIDVAGEYAEHIARTLGVLD